MYALTWEGSVGHATYFHKDSWTISTLCKFIHVQCLQNVTFPSLRESSSVHLSKTNSVSAWVSWFSVPLLETSLLQRVALVALRRSTVTEPSNWLSIWWLQLHAFVWGAPCFWLVTEEQKPHDTEASNPLNRTGNSPRAAAVIFVKPKPPLTLTLAQLL